MVMTVVRLGSTVIVGNEPVVEDGGVTSGKRYGVGFTSKFLRVHSHAKGQTFFTPTLTTEYGY